MNQGTNGGLSEPVAFPLSLSLIENGFGLQLLDNFCFIMNGDYLSSWV